MDLVVASYKAAKHLPADERFGLATQMQRAAVSIPANIAERYGRTHRGDYLHHLSVANGSLKELETHFLIALRLGQLQTEQLREAQQLADEVGRMLRSLLDKLSTRHV